ncbi:helix-turn-helix domain-containing protein [Nitratireductor mangrovi]|uniref:Helix-turn-helix domain-containing protein n=1 Tax=Nitratireductor mangrovi TaxID=2599600 RepID=A0A5B8L076_9HYPH|nr:IclR family transcriptional regulator C-terminal domain-containing protein [Nitratireductor mangrovi]QDZ01434.1 helix-turn-helix domain-containing protein [Nitratireductor mangrovi]
MEPTPESTRADAVARDLVGSLERGLAVMEILAAHPAGLTLTEMAAEAGLTRAGARRFLLTLVASGYAVQDGRTFRLSSRLLAVARTWLGGASLWTFAEPFMRAVSERFGEACSAAELSGEDVVYVARVPGRHIVSIGLNVGTRLPAFCTSMGRVLLSGLSAPELDRFLAKADIRSLTPKTLTSRAALRSAILAAARDGHALVDEELEPGLRSIAVPVRDRSGAIVAAINVSTQSARLSARQMTGDVLPVLRETATRIEHFFVAQ